MTDPYESLANAIVMQAVKDYRDAKHKLKKKPRNENAKAVRDECERFFLSEWFTTLTDVDGQMILKKLQEEDT